MLQDLRLGLRMLLKNPGFSAVIVATLALGIGANVALFSVVNGVLLNPLPLPDPDQLVTLAQSKPNFEAGAIPYPNFRDMQKENRTFSAIAISRGYGFSLLGSGEPERVTARLISADFFSVLGVQPVLGRTFAPGEDEPGAPPLVLISNDLWQRKFNASHDVIGKGLTLDDKSYTVVGVLPANVPLFRTTDVFVPIGQWNSPALKRRSAALGLHGIGRLKPGVTVEQGEADLDRIMADLAVAYPDTNKGNGAKVSPLKERIVGNIGPILWMLLGAVGFVLLIACVNVSNLLLARSTGRTREFAIRTALGAGRWRLLRQSLTESMLLALTGGTLGLIVAGWGTQAALAALPTTIPRAADVGLDGRVLIFTVVISMLTGILSGLAPALKISQWRLSETLKEGGRGASGGHGRAQGLLVALEMALALVLLIGAGLMIRSLSALWNVDPGFRPDNVWTFGLSLSPSMMTAKQAQLYEPFRQIGSGWSGIGVVLRSVEGTPLPFDFIRSVVQNHNKQNVITRPQTMNEVISGTLASRRFAMILLDAFAVVALLLASLGLYGVISYLVGQRTHELGIRLALGARRQHVLALVLGHGMKMALAGIALGLVAAFALTRLLSKMLYGVSATDPATFTVIALLLMIVALLACYVPARRATKVDPLVALRYE